MDLLALDSNFYAERGANIAALNCATADPDIARKAGSLERVVESSAARIADQRMSGMLEIVIIAKFFQIRLLRWLATSSSSDREGAEDELV